MCVTCGCGHGQVRIEPGEAAKQSSEGGHRLDGHHHHHGHDQEHDHDHDHHHDHDAGHDHPRIVEVERSLLAKNDGFAAANRGLFAASGALALNLVSSPGSGKTSLLVETLRRLKDEMPLAVVEGDQQTSNDAERIRATGVKAVQINTGKGCHLDAHMVGHAFEHLRLELGAVLFIENVGNLVCPALFDLGEAHRVVLVSVTEGEDKPLKYPDIFRSSHLLLISKIDLLPHLDFDVGALIANARAINPGIKILQVSARTGEDMDGWLGFIRAARALALTGLAA